MALSYTHLLYLLSLFNLSFANQCQEKVDLNTNSGPVTLLYAFQSCLQLFHTQLALGS